MSAARYALGALLLFAAGRAAAQDATPAPAPEPAPPESTLAPDAPAVSATPANDPEASIAAPAAEVDTSAGVASVAPPDEMATPTASPAPGPSEALTDAELAAMGLSAEDQGLDTALHFSGFMDVNFGQLLNPRDAPLNVLVMGDKGSLFVGHFNLYVTKNVTESFRMMTEVRFTYSPNGASSDFTSAQTTYTQSRDYIGTGSSVRWGGIVIERAYGEWSPLSFLNLRFGAFLTPYGIWNVDHGSPVFIPVQRPYAVNGAFFPEHQTGIEAFGRWGLSTDLSMRYHLTLSNGLGPVSEYRDLDSNKAIGGRLAFEYLRFGTFQVGGSSFYGKDTTGSVGFGLNGNATALTLNKTIGSQSNVTAMAADLLWKYRGLHVQAEWVGQRLEYTRVGRTPVPTGGQVGVPVNAMAPDSFNWAGYALLGYRLPWWGIMPFGTLEYQRSNTFGLMTKTAFSQVGLNIRPADAVVVKAQYMFGFNGSTGTQLKLVAAQLAWAF